MTHHRPTLRRRGGIYAMVMIGSATVTTMALAGLTFSAEHRIAAQRAADRQASTQLALGAIQAGLHRIHADPSWRDDPGDGWWFDTTDSAGSTKLGVYAPEGGSIAANTCGRVRLRGIGSVGTARAIFEVDLVPEQIWPDDAQRVAQAIGATAYWPLSIPNPDTDTLGALAGQWVGEGPRHAASGVSCTASPSMSATDYLQVPYDARFDTPEASIAFWYIQVSPQTKAGLVTRTSGTQSKTGVMALTVQGDSVVAELNSSTQTYTLTQPGITSGSWHHVVLTLGSSGMNLYIDGQQVAANDYRRSWYDASCETCTSRTFLIGTHTTDSEDAQEPASSAVLNGAVAHLAVFGHQLTEGEVQTLYDAQRAPSPMRIVAGSWRRVVD